MMMMVKLRKNGFHCWVTDNNHLLSSLTQPMTRYN